MVLHSQANLQSEYSELLHSNLTAVIELESANKELNTLQETQAQLSKALLDLRVSHDEQVALNKDQKLQLTEALVSLGTSRNCRGVVTGWEASHNVGAGVMCRVLWVPIVVRILAWVQVG